MCISSWLIILFSFRRCTIKRIVFGRGKSAIPANVEPYALGFLHFFIRLRANCISLARGARWRWLRTFSVKTTAAQLAAKTVMLPKLLFLIKYPARET